MNLSVIIPVYKKEAYIEQCLRQLLSQDFTDFEVVCVDDGSPDGSGAICDRLSAEDSRVRVIHTENQGVTAARRRGYEESRGRYIVFVDSDDELLPGALSTLYDSITTTGADEVIATYRDQYGAVYDTGRRGWVDGDAIVDELLSGHTGICVLWGIIFRRELLSGTIDTPRQIQSGEDIMMQIKCLMKQPRVWCIANQVYLYRRDLPNSRPFRLSDEQLYDEVLRQALAPRFERFERGYVWHQVKVYERFLEARQFSVRRDYYHDLPARIVRTLPFKDRLAYCLPPAISYIPVALYKWWLRRTVRLLIPLLLLIGTQLGAASPADSPASPVASGSIGQLPLCPMELITPESLPPLNTARSGACIFVAGGEVVVAGGHTKGFLPCSTAEYLSSDDHKWHEVPMTYAHDNGFSVTTDSGLVMVGGGHSDHLGIGQTFPVERYNPATHSFEGFSCLDRKRSLCSALPIDSGRVIVAGNHYAPDGIEIFDGGKFFHDAKATDPERVNPYILRTAKDNVIVFGANNKYMCRMSADSCAHVNQLKGEPYDEPLLQQWFPIVTDQPYRPQDAFIGCEATEDYTYLVAATDSTGQLALLKVSNGRFSLLTTDSRVPQRTAVSSQSIYWCSQLVADTLRRKAYVAGCDSTYHFYMLAIDYARQPASLRLYYTDPLPEASMTTAVVTPEGNVMMAGGINYNADNYFPRATVWLFRFTPQQPSAAASWWYWLLAAALILLILAALLARRRSARATGANEASGATGPNGAKKANGAYEANRANGANEAEKGVCRAVCPPGSPEGSSAPEAPVASDSSSISELLMRRIDALMQEQRLFTNPSLKLQDIAEVLHSNTKYVSQAINTQKGLSFSQYLNQLRIDYAKQLIADETEEKMVVIASKAGYSSETSFFRNFKLLTGMTPTEWRSAELQKIDNS